MLGGSEALYEVTGAGWEPVGEHVHEQLVMTLRRELSEARLAEMWSSGRRMPLASLVAYAVEFIDSHIAVDDAPTRDREPTFTLQERPVRAPTNLPRPASSFLGREASSRRSSRGSSKERGSSLSRDRAARARPASRSRKSQRRSSPRIRQASSGSGSRPCAIPRS